MREEADLIYYRQREAIEREAHRSAPHEKVAETHLVLAERYAEKVATIEQSRNVRPPALGMALDPAISRDAAALEVIDNILTAVTDADVTTLSVPQNYNPAMLEFSDDELSVALADALYKEASDVVWLIVNEIERRDNQVGL